MIYFQIKLNTYSCILSLLIFVFFFIFDKKPQMEFLFILNVENKNTVASVIFSFRERERGRVLTEPKYFWILIEKKQYQRRSWFQPWGLLFFPLLTRKREKELSKKISSSTELETLRIRIHLARRKSLALMRTKKYKVSFIVDT